MQANKFDGYCIKCILQRAQVKNFSFNMIKGPAH